MKRRNSPLFRYAAAICGIVLMLANAANPPNGNTGAPFDGTCANSSCHGTANPNGYAGTVTISGIPDPIPPSTTFSITLTVDVTGGSPTRAGFQMVAVQGNNTNAGDFTSAAGTGTETFGGREYIEHRNPQNFAGGSASWTFTWKSPASSNGNTVTFYFTGNIANGSGSGGDLIVTNSATYTFQGAPPLTASIVSSTNVSCGGGNDGSATAEGDGGQAPYNYAWSNGQNQATATNLPAGTYTVTVTSAVPGSATAQVTITQPPALSLTATATSPVTCQNPGTAMATASGGTSGYTYEWSDGTQGQFLSTTVPGVFTVTATDANNCTKTANVTVSSNIQLPIANAGPAQTLSCTQTTATLNGNASSQGANYAYVWSGPNIVSGANTLTPVVGSPGTYSLTVTNTINSCTAAASTLVTGNTTPPNVTATGATLSCANPSATITCTSNAASPNFQWSGPGGFTSGVHNPSVTMPGVYTLTITDGVTGCTSTASAPVTGNFSAPNVTASGGTISCISPNTTLTGSSTSAITNWHWEGPNNFSSNQQNPSVSATGTYNLTVTASNGCTATASASVTGNVAQPNVSATGGTLTCSASSVTLNGNSTTAGVAYAWTGPNGFISLLQNPTVSVPGDYLLVVANAANGCTNSTAVTVVQNIAQPGASAVGGTITCSTPNVTLNGNSPTGGTTFAWAGPNGYASTQQNPNVNQTGTYVLTVTNPANGCTSTASTTVSENTNAPTASATVSGSLNCSTTALQLNGTGSSQGANFTYNWGGACITSGTNTLTPTVNCAGNYVLTVTNANNGCVSTASVAVSQTPPVLATLGTVNGVACFGGSNGSASVNGSGGAGNLNYAWSNGQSTQTATGLAAGTYFATVSDGAGCTATVMASVTQPQLLAANASATAETAAGANNGTATAAPSGGTPAFQYIWSTGSTTASIGNLHPGTYIVTVSDANGCTAVQTVTVNSFNCSVSASATSVNVSCNGSANGSASVSLTGANGQVTYLWSNGATTASVTGLAPGAYTVQMTDANNCPASASVNITEPPALQANASATDETANQSHDGTATAQPTGGTSPYSYLWNTNATTQSIQSLAAGTYIVTVTDANNCSSVQTVVVNAFNCAIASSVTSVQVLCHGDATGQATIGLNGGTAPFTYLWSNGATTATASNLPAGNYTVMVTDALGCVVNQSVLINEPALLLPGPIAVTNVVCLEDESGSISLQAQGGMSPYTYEWSNGQTGASATELGVGAYFVLIEDANGCLTLDSATVQAIDNVLPTLVCPSDVTVCKAEAVQFDMPTGSDNCILPANAVTQTAGLPSGSVFPVGETLQSFEIRDAQGNTNTCSYTITVAAPLLLNSTVTDENEGLGNGAIQVNVQPAGNYEYQWTGPNGFTASTPNIEGLRAGTYTLVITDENGCQTSLTVEVDNIVGTSQPGELASLRLFPNPSAELIRLETNRLQALHGRIADMRGRMVRDISEMEIKDAIDISMLPPGAYCLQVWTDEGQWRVLRFVKQ